MKLTFHGAAGEVTGSCHLVETRDARFLVDCGMFQGGKEARKKNLDALDFDLESLDFVLVTHAHIDHSGLLPRLVALGYRGPIYATPATRELLAVMLHDSAYIQEKEAEKANYLRQKSDKKSRKKPRDVAPLYTVMQADACLKQIEGAEYGTEFTPHPSVRCRFRDAGHILGSAITEVWVTERDKTRKIVFSGDLGHPGQPIVEDPTPIEDADILLVESTYGNRQHKSWDDTLNELVYAIRDTVQRKGGNVVIPAFAVGRTQDMLFLLYDLVRQGRLHNLDVYVDSPMGMKATEITMQHQELWDEEAKKVFAWGNHSHNGIRVHFAEQKEDSMAINDIRRGAVIISSSGMCEAGRIKYHLRYNLGRKECSILFTGFQAAGTLGRRIIDGAKLVRIHQQEIPVRADLYTLGGLSAHADQAALLGWLGRFRNPPKKTFVVHGELTAAEQFAKSIGKELGWKGVTVPALGTMVEL
jgi:Predicted exonuclease of the beta-lactamase fold involved in RNA processing